MLSAQEQIILEAFRSGHRHLYKLAIVTDFNKRIVKDALRGLCNQHYLEKVGKGKYRLLETVSIQDSRRNLSSSNISRYPAGNWPLKSEWGKQSLTCC